MKNSGQKITIDEQYLSTLSDDLRSLGELLHGLEHYQSANMAGMHADITAEMASMVAAEVAAAEVTAMAATIEPGLDPLSDSAMLLNMVLTQKQASGAVHESDPELAKRLDIIAKFLHGMVGVAIQGTFPAGMETRVAH